MRSILIMLMLLSTSLVVRCQHHQKSEDDETGSFNDDGSDDFSEFEDFDADDDGYVQTKQQNDPKEAKETVHKSGAQQSKVIYEDDADGIVTDEDEDDNEFDHFEDEEEFEGFSKTEHTTPGSDQKIGEPKLTVAKVPMHFRTHWDSYWMEMIMIAGLLAYFTNYIVGRNKNSKLANLWLTTHRSLLDDNFVLVGDDGKVDTDGPVGFIKESDNLYTLWCSGRTCCEGMLVELKMIKRQDLIAVISDLMKPSQDQVHIKIELSKDIMDTFVFCVASRRTATKFFKEMYDLNKFCILVNNPESKYNVPSGFSVLSEISEASAAMLDSRVLTVLNKYGHLVDYIYVTDQYNGVIQQEDTSATLKMPEVKRQLLVGFNLPKANDMETAKALLVLVFYLLEKIKRYRLSKEGKQKADKNRQRVEEEFLKSTHGARAEAAALRREEKRKQEKERVMSEDDPEKQRRWEKKEQKRQQKRKAPKMKQLSIKAL